MQSRFAGVCLLVLLAPALSLALTVNPQKYEIRQALPGSYPVILTLINQDSSVYDVSAVLSSESSYLGQYVRVEPGQFSIGPNENRNIRLTLFSGDGLSPEKHELELLFVSGRTTLGRFRLVFTVPGTPVMNFSLDNVRADYRGGLLHLGYFMNNRGNVIVRATPVVEILENGRLLDTAGEESRVLIMPGQDYNLSFLYDMSAYLPGQYMYRTKISYNGLETGYHEGNLHVLEQEDHAPRQLDVAQGENYTLELLAGKDGQLSFYQAECSIAGRFNQSFEGELREEGLVRLELPTWRLSPGSYTMRLYLRTGARLEDEQRYDYTVRVGRSLSPAVPLALFGAVLLGGAAYYLARRQHSGLERQVAQLWAGYDALERDAVALTRAVGEFITESNRWLSVRGYKHGFR